MSGIPGMGQRWQAALKIRVIMIPLPENTAAGAASGVSIRAHLRLMATKRMKMTGTGWFPIYMRQAW